MLPRKSVQGAREQSFLVQHFLSDGLEDPLTSDFAIQILNHAKRRLLVLMIAHEKKQGKDCAAVALETHGSIRPGQCFMVPWLSLRWLQNRLLDQMS